MADAIAANQIYGELVDQVVTAMVAANAATTVDLATGARGRPLDLRRDFERFKILIVPVGSLPRRSRPGLQAKLVPSTRAKELFFPRFWKVVPNLHLQDECCICRMAPTLVPRSSRRSLSADCFVEVGQAKNMECPPRAAR